jgi:polysaccharide export outer membrane protein
MASRVQAVVDACKAAGFNAVSMETSPLGGSPRAASLPAYVIEPPDILRVLVLIDPKGADGKPASRRVLYELSGEQSVRPDGTIKLGSCGAVGVTGLTTDQATAAVRRHLAGHDAMRDKGIKADDLVVSVEVTAYNSKRYYVITAGPNGEEVCSFPITGSETVLDALRNVGGPPAVAGKSNIWVARRNPHTGEPEQILPVDLAGITREGNSATNYQLLPGDRVYIKAK